MGQPTREQSTEHSTLHGLLKVEGPPQFFTLLAMIGNLEPSALAFGGLQEPLATVPIVLDNAAVAVGFASEDIGKAEVCAQHLYRLAVWSGFWFYHLRMM